MEALMSEVAKMKNVVAQRSEEIARLTAESERRKAAVPASDESDAVRRLRHEIAQRQDDLERMRSEVAEKEHENAQYMEMLERERQQQALYGPGDMHEVVQIRERRQQNDELQAQVRQLMAKLSLLTVQQRDVERSLEDKEHQAQEAKRRAEQNQQTEKEFAEQLQDLGQLKDRHLQREEELKELNQIIEEMDVSFQQVDGVMHALDVEQTVAGSTDGSGAADFERSPLLGVWLGSVAAALATMNVARISDNRGQRWVTPRQQEQAQLDISKRIAEIGAVKQRLNERLLQMKQLVEGARSRLEDAQQQREEVRADRDELQRTLDGDQAILIGNLQAQMSVLEQHRVAAESAEAHAKSEWEEVEAGARAKYAEAEAVLEKHRKLLEWENEQTREIYGKNRAQQDAEKAALLSMLQEQPEQPEQPVGYSYTSPA
jgi:chromosome segregation ATPase